MHSLSSLFTLLSASPWSSLLAALILGYLLGSIPFGLLLTKAAGLGDVRGIGSGNIGATNVLRTGNKGLAALTLVLDAAKGAVAVLAAEHFFGEGPAYLAALGALAGHVFPVWLQFKGGKGVATFLGILAALAWQAAAVFAALWLAIALSTRFSSLAAIVATAATPFAVWASGHREFAVIAGVMSVIILLKHRGNLRRLLAGEEPKIGAKA
jgi:acyl phosphate:glycerol-3-phosphate acyltransferase